MYTPIDRRSRVSIRRYLERKRQHRALVGLDARLLADIGLASESQSWEGIRWRWPDWI